MLITWLTDVLKSSSSTGVICIKRRSAQPTVIQRSACPALSAGAAILQHGSNARRAIPAEVYASQKQIEAIEWRSADAHGRLDVHS